MKKRKYWPRTQWRSIPSFFKRYLISALIALILGGAFWIQHTVTEVRLPQTGEPAEIYSNQGQDDLTHIFTNAIQEAKESILLVIYAITDKQIIASLRHKSEEGIKVLVICDAKTSPNIEAKLGPKVETIRRFSLGLMHQKILVIDNKQTWISTANMTSESLRMHGNLITAFESEPLAQHVTAKANTLKAEGQGPSFPHQAFNVGGQLVELWFLPDDRGAISHLKDLIQTAKKSIRVAMFTWTRRDLAEAIIAAAKRGVKTEVVIDYYSGKGASERIVNLLKRNGVSVSLSTGGPLLHYKFLYIDSATLINGSANWTKAAFTQNDDCFIIVDNLNEKQKEYMETLWMTIRTSSAPLRL